MVIKPVKRQFLHDRIAEQLRASIQTEWQPGQRLESETVLAKSAGVSLVTLRNAMLILEREGLIERTPGRGTFVAKGSGFPPSPSGLRRAGTVQGSELPTGPVDSSNPKPETPNNEPGTKNQEPLSQKHIAIFCGGEVFSPHPSYFYLGAVSALRRFFTEHNLVSQVYFNHREIEDRDVAGPMVEAGDHCPEFTQAIADHRVSAAAFLSGLGDCTWCQALRAQKAPVVGDIGFDVGVSTDWAAMGSMGARQLVARGCRRLALIAWAGEERLPLATRNDLVGGFCKEIQRMGLTINEAWIRHDLPADREGSGWEDLREIWNACPEKPDGLFVSDDMMLDDVTRAVAELGIDVPTDLRIVSHANRGAAYFEPFPVDRIELDPVEFGRTLGNLLLQRLRGETPREPVITLHHQVVQAGGPQFTEAAKLVLAGQSKTRK